MRPRKSSGGVRPWIVTAALAAWIVLIVHCQQFEPEAVKLALILPPVFGTALLLAFRLRSSVLTLFMGFVFVSHAIAPPFFFLQKQNYTYGGDFGAVKNFSFHAAELLRIYQTVFIFVFAVLAFAAIGIRMTRRPVRRQAESRQKSRRPDTRGRARYDFLILAFLALVAIPQSLVMYQLRVGVTGLISPILPYRLTGLLYYSRGFAYPVLLFVAYALSKRTLPTAIAIVLYSWLGALCASSRYLLVISAASVMLFAIIDGRRMRLFVTAGALAFAFMTVTYSRAYIYSASLPLTEYVAKSIRRPEDYSRINGWDFIGGIALRLYGPQDVVLAYQYDVQGRAGAIARWFVDRPAIDDITYALYGMTFNTGVGFNVGIGLIPYMILLSRRSFLILTLLAAVIGLLLVLGHAAVERVRRIKLLNIWMIADPLAFFLVYVLYTAASMRWYYELMVLCFAGAWLSRLVVGVNVSRPAMRRPLELNENARTR